MNQPTAGESSRSLNMAWIWAAVLFVVAVVNGLLTPWDAIKTIIQDQGVGDEGAGLIAFAAGYTLPLTAGTVLLTYLGLRGAHRERSGPTVLIFVGAVFLVAGLLSSTLGLGLAPDLSIRPRSAPPYVSLPLWALEAYFNRYGWPLMITGLVIGGAFGLQLYRWIVPAAAVEPALSDTKPPS